jgi:hypothetical protein
MHCSFKTMIKFAAGIGVVLAVAYFALPDARAWLLASAPVLLALACPLAMGAMMFMTQGKNSNAAASKNQCAKSGDTTPNAHAGDAVPDKS